MILGLNPQKGLSKNFLGNLTEGILSKNNITTLIYKPAQPLATIKRNLVIVPDKAEKEIGFLLWLYKVWNISKNSGAKVVFYSSANTLNVIQTINDRQPINADFNVFDDWDDFFILSRDVKVDDNIIIQLSRPYKPSFQPNMVKVPHYLNKYFMQNNFILVYPVQFITEHSENLDLKNLSMSESIEKLDDLGKAIAKIFKFK